MPTTSDDPRVLQEFAASPGTHDRKTVATYLTTVRDFVAWLALQPGGVPFHLSLVAETAVRGYMDFLTIMNRAPRTRSKAFSALRRLCWSLEEIAVEDIARVVAFFASDASSFRTGICAAVNGGMAME